MYIMPFAVWSWAWTPFGWMPCLAPAVAVPCPETPARFSAPREAMPAPYQGPSRNWPSETPCPKGKDLAVMPCPCHYPCRMGLNRMAEYQNRPR